MQITRALQKFVATHLSLHFTPSSAILPSTLFSDFFWDRSTLSGQTAAFDILCGLILAFVCWCDAV
jgi:hypothetical protein